MSGNILALEIATVPLCTKAVLSAAEPIRITNTNLQSPGDRAWRSRALCAEQGQVVGLGWATIGEYRPRTSGNAVLCEPSHDLEPEVLERAIDLIHGYPGIVVSCNYSRNVVRFLQKRSLHHRLNWHTPTHRIDLEHVWHGPFPRLPIDLSAVAEFLGLDRPHGLNIDLTVSYMQHEQAESIARAVESRAVAILEIYRAMR